MLFHPHSFNDLDGLKSHQVFSGILNACSNTSVDGLDVFCFIGEQPIFVFYQYFGFEGDFIALPNLVDSGLI